MSAAGLGCSAPEVMHLVCACVDLAVRAHAQRDDQLINHVCNREATICSSRHNVRCCLQVAMGQCLKGMTCFQGRQVCRGPSAEP